MKTTVFALMLCLLCTSIAAQVPQTFKYQAVARNSSGEVLKDQFVSFMISILSSSTSGTVIHSETHTGKKTNSFGLIDLEIGKAKVSTGTFSSIDWGSNLIFVMA